MQARGGDLTGEIHLLGGRFDRVPLLGGRDICSVDRQGQDKAWLLGIVFLGFVTLMGVVYYVDHT